MREGARERGGEGRIKDREERREGDRNREEEEMRPDHTAFKCCECDSIRQRE